MSLILQETAQHTSEWFNAVNPVIPMNAVAIESDTGKTKVGDGVTPYKLLSYSGTVVNDRTVLNQSFYDSACPALSFMLNVDELIEFEFSYGVPGATSGVLNAGPTGNANAITVQLGNTMMNISGSWAMRSHSFQGSANHVTSENTSVGVATISTSYNAGNGYGSIIRRRSINTGIPIVIRSQIYDYAQNVQDRVNILAASQMATLVPNDDPVKVHISIHPDVRGFFKAHKRS